MNIFVSPKITQKRSELYVFSTPFSILIATQREMHQSKKGQCKNLVQTINTLPKYGVHGSHLVFILYTNGFIC